MHHFVTVTPGVVPAETLGCCWLHAQLMPKVSFFVLPLLPPFSRWNIDHCHFFWCVFYLDCIGGIPKCLCVGAKGPKGWNDMDYLRSSPFGFPSWCWSPARHPSEHNSWTKFDKLDGWSKSVWFRSVCDQTSGFEWFIFWSLQKPGKAELPTDGLDSLWFWGGCTTDLAFSDVCCFDMGSPKALILGSQPKPVNVQRLMFKL